KRRSLTSFVVDELPCYPETNVVEERGIFELGEVRCQPKDECSMATRLKQKPEILQTLKEAIQALPLKAENIKRTHVLRELIRVPKEKMTDQQCRQLGDGVFAFFCPVDAIILTTNTKDLRPL